MAEVVDEVDYSKPKIRRKSQSTCDNGQLVTSVAFGKDGNLTFNLPCAPRAIDNIAAFTKEFRGRADVRDAAPHIKSANADTSARVGESDGRLQAVFDQADARFRGFDLVKYLNVRIDMALIRVASA